MSATPGEQPNFDFDSFHTTAYDIGRLSEEVMWPLADSFYRSNFRLSSKTGHQMSVEKGGVFNGEEYDISLWVYNALEEAEGSEKSDVSEEDETLQVYVVGNVELEIESIVTDERRDYVRSRAEEEEVFMDDESVDNAIFKTGVGYCFTSEGELLTHAMQSIEDITGERNWEKSDTGIMMRVDQDSVIQTHYLEPKIVEHDLELIKAAVYLLDAPHAIKTALESIRLKPLPTGNNR